MLWIRIALLVLANGVAAVGSDFCAVRVMLTSKDGSLASALVELRDDTGRVVQRSMADGGVAEFCDFDFGEHSIKIGGTTCAELIIPHVGVVFGSTQVFRAYVNECSGWELSIPRGCRTYFRVSTSDGEKLSGVTVVSQPAGSKTITDAYGRALVRANSGENETVTFSKAGYVSRGLTVKCGAPSYSEQRVTLERLSQ